MKLNPEAVRALFGNVETSSGEITEKLYAMVYPDWESIQQVIGYPEVNGTTARRLMALFRDHDEARARAHRDTNDPLFERFWYNANEMRMMPGGVWFNSGFATTTEQPLDDWEVRPAPVEYKKEDAKP